MSKIQRLNVQGLARRDEKLLRCILPNPGHLVVSSDASAGEPTVTTHFSGDINYRFATFDGVGAAPYYRGPILMISDIYLMVMSVSPIGRAKMKEAFDSKWNGKSFVDQWLEDPEVIKTALKKDRQIHKILALGLGYGMGPKKMVLSMKDAGFELLFDDAKKFFNSYWQLFSGVRKLADRLGRQVEEKGYIINPFGYRMVPEPQKAFNYFIQSSVSGLLNVYMAKLFAAAPYAHLLTIIHDELLIEVPTERLSEFKLAKDRAVDSLNTDLNWSVKLRFGAVEGNNWFEAK